MEEVPFLGILAAEILFKHSDTILCQEFHGEYHGVSKFFLPCTDKQLQWLILLAHVLTSNTLEFVCLQKSCHIPLRDTVHV